ncbi:iron-containing alcohol dehydrogenase [Dongshaea marina]|uniref:iron-containing alcohol dehydrogenase n=1 Tax=Dongshaea marina TaxID=2047966 RepID=UPI000D3E83BF|nr:iron-containing alcohol dehydrogenase [Dongshaea marina]
MANNFIVPAKTFHGIGTLSELSNLAGAKAVIVTGKGSMIREGFVASAQAYLEQAGIASAVFDGVEADPSIETTMKIATMLNQEKPDWIIGLGGCSCIDAAKAAWVFYEHPETKFEEIIPPFTIKPLRKKARFVAIPSTSGTGTEVTCVSVITDRTKGTKYPLVSYELTPDVAIVDGKICQSMPKHVTANTGMDALTHALEAYVTPLADDYTDALAERAVKRIFANLPAAYFDGKSLDARQKMHNASCQAGMSFTNALLGIVHSMAHQVGGMFGVPHGRANAILLPNVIRFNSKVCKSKYDELARAVGMDSCEQLIESIEALRKCVGIEDSFEAYGLSKEVWDVNVKAMAKNALADACTGCNPRQPSVEELETLLNLCFHGIKFHMGN